MPSLKASFFNEQSQLIMMMIVLLLFGILHLRLANVIAGLINFGFKFLVIQLKSIDVGAKAYT